MSLNDSLNINNNKNKTKKKQMACADETALFAHPQT
jgi:hypothetical protein